MATKPSPREQERRFDRASRRFFAAVAGILAFVVLASTAVTTFLVVRVSDLERTNADQALEHRVRNELIHSCLVRKQDAFRRDVYQLLQTKPGTPPQFPEADGIVCPPVNP